MRMTKPSHPKLLQELMTAKGLTQADLVRETGESKQTIHKLYHGKTDMGDKWAKRLAPLLGVPHWPMLLGWEAPDDALPPVDSPAAPEESSDISRSDPPSQRDLAQDAQELLLLTIWKDIPSDRRDLCLLFLENMRDKSRSKISKRD